MKEFTTPQRDIKTVEFTLDGEIYHFTTPKRAGLIMSIVNTVGLDKQSVDTDSTRDLLNWIGEGLPEDEADRLLERLQDPSDDFDLGQVNDIAKYLLGQGANRPTRRRSGS